MLTLVTPMLTLVTPMLTTVDHCWPLFDRWLPAVWSMTDLWRISDLMISDPVVYPEVVHARGDAPIPPITRVPSTPAVSTGTADTAYHSRVQRLHSVHQAPFGYNMWAKWPVRWGLWLINPNSMFLEVFSIKITDLLTQNPYSPRKVFAETVKTDEFHGISWKTVNNWWISWNFMKIRQ